MSDYFIGQIMLSGFGFAPRNFAMCSGQTMAISQNQALFSLLGTYYGGDGVRTFMLPDLRGRTPVGFGSSYQPGNSFGTESVTLLASQSPAHTHTINATTSAGGARNPSGSIFGAPPNGSAYANASTGATPLNAQQMQNAGGNLPHPNVQPYNVLNFSMCIYGIFPTRG